MKTKLFKNTFIKTTLLITLSTIAIASSGLKKIPLNDTLNKIYRVDLDLPETEIERRKIHFNEKKPLVERGFFGGSYCNCNDNVGVKWDGNSYALIVNNTEGKPVRPYSAQRREEERVLPAALRA